MSKKEPNPGEKNKGGRPPIIIEDHKLKSIMKYRPTLLDTAAHFECSMTTIETYIKNNYGMDFKEFRQRHMVSVKFQILDKVMRKMELNLKNNKGDNDMIKYYMANCHGWKGVNADQQDEFEDRVDEVIFED